MKLNKIKINNKKPTNEQMNFLVHEIKRVINLLDIDVYVKQINGTALKIVNARLNDWYLKNIGYNGSPYTTNNNGNAKRGRILGWQDWKCIINAVNVIADIYNISCNFTSTMGIAGTIKHRNGTEITDNYENHAYVNVGSIFNPVYLCDAWYPRDDSKGRQGWMKQANKEQLFYACTNYFNHFIESDVLRLLIKEGHNYIDKNIDLDKINFLFNKKESNPENENYYKIELKPTLFPKCVLTKNTNKEILSYICQCDSCKKYRLSDNPITDYKKIEISLYQNTYFKTLCKVCLSTRYTKCNNCNFYFSNTDKEIRNMSILGTYRAYCDLCNINKLKEETDNGKIFVGNDTHSRSFIGIDGIREMFYWIIINDETLILFNSIETKTLEKIKKELTDKFYINDINIPIDILTEMCNKEIFFMKLLNYQLKSNKIKTPSEIPIVL